MFLLYHAYVYLEFLILACTIYILAPKIVRNDITKVKADAIVNTANPNPICASGTDLAIYEAAGKEKLLAERAGIGKIARGDIDSYIDANYVRESHRKEYPVRSRSNARMRGLTEERE